MNGLLSAALMALSALSFLYPPPGTDAVSMLASYEPKPQGFIFHSYVEDWNNDGLPEIFFREGDGWAYDVYYYHDGAVRSVEGLTPWAWSSTVLLAPDGSLVMMAEGHTTGTAGILQYRVYNWGEDGYVMTEDLWRFPDQYNEDFEPATFTYLGADHCIDPFLPDGREGQGVYSLTQEQFTEKTAGFETLPSLSYMARSWSAPRNALIIKCVQAEILLWAEAHAT